MPPSIPNCPIPLLPTGAAQSLAGTAVPCAWQWGGWGEDVLTMKQGRWLGRKARWIRPDRNPLRRKLDRVEAFIIGGLIVAAAAGAPVTAMPVSHWAHTAAARAAQQERESSFQTQAVLLANPSETMSGYTMTATGSALARWTTPAGTSRDGVVPVPDGSARGTTVPIWTTA